MICIYTRFKLIVFLISNITLVLWLLYDFVRLNKYLKCMLKIKIKNYLL